MKEYIRILIVDDSALLRSALCEMLESDPMIQVVGEAANGREALQLAAELHPNVITMDVRMPIMDGLETTERLMAYTPTPVLAITSLYARDDVDISFKMLGAGALEVMAKPDISSPLAYDRARHELIRRVKVLARVRVVTHLRGRRRFEQQRANDEPHTSYTPVTFTIPSSSSVSSPSPLLPTSMPASATSTELSHQPISTKKTRASSSRAGRVNQASQAFFKPQVPPAPRPLSSHPPHEPPVESVEIVPMRPHLARLRFPVVVIGASTGGPRVVQQILKGIPQLFDAAVLVVQHIAEGFSAGMVEWLANTCSIPVKLAVEGDKITTSTVLVAPDGFHLYVQHEGRVHLDSQPDIQRPSVDITMQTTAAVFGSYTTGVLLTGMGRDGAVGMQHIYRVGGYTIAQDEASCSIYGMPRAAVELNVVADVLSPDAIVQTLVNRFVHTAEENS